MTLMLKSIPNYNKPDGPVLLIIMDGIGIGKYNEANAVNLANTPNLDNFFQTSLYTELKAHGTAVGLPSDDDMGNSEVGHNALGSGRIVSQGAKLVNEAIASGSLFQEEIWNKLIDQVKVNNSTLHFIGLLSDGNVHSHIDQLFALIKHAGDQGVKKIRVHTLLDGRDVAEKSALIYIEQLENLLSRYNQQGLDYKIASGGGRMVTTMDRYNADWAVVKQGWDAHVLGKGRFFSSAKEAIQTYYEEDPKITDQYLPSFVIIENQKPIGAIEDNDSVIFFNFRGDRAIEISLAFDRIDFNEFERERYPKVLYAGMMQYDGDLHIPKNYLVNPPQIEKTMGEYLCEIGISSFAISETQKYGHVTYFWNGNRSGYLCKDLEDYFEIKSDVIPFDQAPKMKAPEITNKVIELLKSGKYKFGRLNFANGDMVGHTGIMSSAIEAVETVDDCVGKLVEQVKKQKGIVIITADHGNADEMFTMKNNEKIPKTSHTLNPVPFVILDYTGNNVFELDLSVKHPGLANVASTIITILGYQPPIDYEQSIIKIK